MPTPPVDVARMFKVRLVPFVLVIPIWVQVKLGSAPVMTAGLQVAPFVVYSHPVIMLSLSVKAVVRSKGLSTKVPNCVLDGVTVPAVGGVVSVHAAVALDIALDMIEMFPTLSVVFMAKAYVVLQVSPVTIMPVVGGVGSPAAWVANAQSASTNVVPAL